MLSPTIVNNISVDNCIFCQESLKKKTITENWFWRVVMDEYPVSMGHCLIIPKRHVNDYFGLNIFERISLSFIIKEAKKYLEGLYHPNGYNIGINCGADSGQTIFHCHIHLIPRYNGDVDNPKGGVRGIIPNKQHY